MSYIEIQKLNEEDLAALTAAELAKRGITEMPGYGGAMIDVNSHGFLVNPAGKLPDGLLGKLQANWASANGNVDAFYNSQIDGQSVRSIFSQMPSQQSYSIGAKLDGFPRGTAIPSHKWGNEWTAIKWEGTSNPPVNQGTTLPPATTAAPVAAPVADPTPVDAVAAGPHWWDFFVSKDFLIPAAVIAGVIALLKYLNNTIKMRFRKCAKVLYKMQKDFGGAEEGMDMKAVLPGVGSKIMDWIAFIWTPKKGKGKNKGALGLRPFVDNYNNEIAADYDQALRSYNMIASYKYEANADTTTSGALNNHEAPEPKETEAHESVNVDNTVYESFADALKTTALYESANPNEQEHLDEAALGLAIAAGSLTLSAIRMFKGQYRTKVKNANGQYEEKSIAVTQKSTREICYAILNMFYGKYFNLEKVFKKMGIEDFADVDASNVDKFQKIANKMAESSEGDAGTTNSKMYVRVNKAYNEMVDAYLRVANGVVDNFAKYTRKKKQEKGKDLGEKDANLLLAAKEKLRAEVKRQEDAYKNNFPRVLNAIISAPAYAKFTDLIIKKVIPLFKTGLAGDADYVLDLLPKTGDYYIVRQTGQQQGLEANDEAKGNVALVRILEVRKEGEEGNQKVFVKFARTALLHSADGIAEIERDGHLVYDMKQYDPKNMERTAYSNNRADNADRSEGGDAIDLAYGKWISLDPREVVNVPGDDRDQEDIRRTKLYRREITINEKAVVEYAYGEAPVSVSSGTTTQEFAEDVDISEAKVQLTREKPVQSKGEADPMNKDANIAKIVCVNILKDQEANLTSGNIESLQFTGAVIELKTPCTAQQLGEMLVDINKFNPAFAMQDGMVKEKDAIVSLVSKQQGYTHVSNVEVNSINEVPETFKKIETRQTTSENLIVNVDKKAEEWLQQVNALNLTPEKITYPFSPVGNASKEKDLYVCPKDGKNPYYINFNTGIKDKRGYEVIFIFYPTLLDANGQIIKPQSAEPLKQPIQGAVVGIAATFFNHGHGESKPPYHPAKLDKESIKAAYLAVVNDLKDAQFIEPERGKQLGSRDEVSQQPAQPAAQPAAATPQPAGNSQNISASFNITYSDMFNLAESFMGTLSYLNVHRFIKAEQPTKEEFYVLSENAWGDGVTMNPVAKLNEFVESTLKTCQRIEDFTRLAKSSVSVNFMPLSEDCSYKTTLPYNRYKMLTEVNPLYEATVILSFDPLGNVNKVINKGVTKICK